MKLKVEIDYEAEELAQSVVFLGGLMTWLRTITVVKVGPVVVTDVPEPGNRSEL